MRVSIWSVVKGSGACGALILGLLAMPSAPKASAKFQGPSHARVAELGKVLFNDKTLSNPTGMACVTCHDPKAGFSYPDSDINKKYGVVMGVVDGRVGFRKPPTAAYATYLPTGIPTYDPTVQAYVGGLFYDGRAADLVEQAKSPFLNADEMNDLVHNVGSPALVVSKIENGPSRVMFQEVYGQDVFDQPADVVYGLMAQAIAAYEGTPEVAPFSSKYDAYLAGLYTLNTEELRGLREVTGSITGRPGGVPFPINAHCSECHGIPSVQTAGSHDLWTNSCYANLGVPKNLRSPYYEMTDESTNPAGYNAQGFSFIDYGLGDFLYPLMGKPIGDLAENDPLAIDGTFKTPTLRNVDARPYPGFVKSYMHNGVFKSLQQVVHFYNTRNLTSVKGEVIDFTKKDPYANLKGVPKWGKPEWPSPISMINPQGLPNDNDSTGMGGEQIGNMGLSPYDEQCIVAFLQTLTDGYFDPQTGKINPTVVRP